MCALKKHKFCSQGSQTKNIRDLSGGQMTKTIADLLLILSSSHHQYIVGQPGSKDNFFLQSSTYYLVHSNLRQLD